MKRAIWIVLGILVLAIGAAAEEATSESEILAVLHAAESGWNAGDLDAYMQSYWRSEELRFAGGAKVSYGWEKVLKNYRTSYPDQATMGHLTFDELDVTVLGEEAALVFGRWALERTGDAEGEKPHGVFTLLFRKLSDGWRIVHDHTSSG